MIYNGFTVIASNFRPTQNVDQYIGLFLYSSPIQKEANVLVYPERISMSYEFHV